VAGFGFPINRFPSSIAGFSTSRYETDETQHESVKTDNCHSGALIGP
jgi:hypothetical protein